MPLPGVSPSALLSSGVRLSKLVELSLSKSLIAADNFPWKTSFAKTLDMSSTVLAFEFPNFPWMNLTSFSKRSKCPCLHRFNLHSIAALCFLLLEVADGVCRIMVWSTIKVFKATEFTSEFELNCFIQNVSSSIEAFPALPYGTLVMVFTMKFTIYNFIVNTIDSITEPLMTDIAPCFVFYFSGKHIVIG